MAEEREPYTEREDELVREKSVDRNRFLAMAIIMLVSLGGLVSFDIVYNSYRQRQADQRFCAMFVGMDDYYQSIPNRNPRLEEFAGYISDLRKGFHCPYGPPVVLPDTPPPTSTQAPVTGTPTSAGTR